jgi:hypothetical protein
MKRIALLVLVFCVGLLAASFAFADDGGKKGRDGSASTSTSSGDEGQGKDKKKCHNVSLKGTAPATSFTVTVEKANKAGRDLKSATITFSGKVSINAQMCSGDSTAAASTFKLRNLKVGKASSEGSDG